MLDSLRDAPFAASWGVSATSEAWRILQGESPCRVRVSHSPVSSLARCAEIVDRKYFPESDEDCFQTIEQAM